MEKRFIVLLCLLVSIIFAGNMETQPKNHILSLDLGGIGGLVTLDYQYQFWSHENAALRANIALGSIVFVSGIQSGINYVLGNKNQLITGIHAQYYLILDFDQMYDGDYISRWAVSPKIAYARVINSPKDQYRLGVHIYFSPRLFLDDLSFSPWGGIGLEFHL